MHRNSAAGSTAAKFEPLSLPDPYAGSAREPAGERDLKALLAAYPSDGKSVADVLETFRVTQRAPGSTG